ncbi:hypothetical protein ACQ4PT_012331 [Festuca glaucescens]
MVPPAARHGYPTAVPRPQQPQFRLQPPPPGFVAPPGPRLAFPAQHLRHAAPQPQQPQQQFYAPQSVPQQPQQLGVATQEQYRPAMGPQQPVQHQYAPAMPQLQPGVFAPGTAPKPKRNKKKKVVQPGVQGQSMPINAMQPQQVGAPLVQGHTPFVPAASGTYQPQFQGVLTTTTDVAASVLSSSSRPPGRVVLPARGRVHTLARTSSGALRRATTTPASPPHVPSPIVGVEDGRVTSDAPAYPPSGFVDGGTLGGCARVQDQAAPPASAVPLPAEAAASKQRTLALAAAAAGRYVSAAASGAAEHHRLTSEAATAQRQAMAEAGEVADLLPPQQPGVGSQGRGIHGGGARRQLAAIWSSISVGWMPAFKSLQDSHHSFDEAALEGVRRAVVGGANEVISLKGYTSWAIGYSVRQFGGLPPP